MSCNSPVEDRASVSRSAMTERFGAGARTAPASSVWAIPPIVIMRRRFRTLAPSTKLRQANIMPWPIHGEIAQFLPGVITDTDNWDLEGARLFKRRQLKWYQDPIT